MKIKQILLLSLIALLPKTVFADFTPTAYYAIDGENFETTDVIADAQAPLLVEFKANPSNLDENTSVSYEWRFTKEGEANPYLVRYEENTSFEFMESGATNIALYVAFGDNDAELISTIKISISTSILEMPNAFSPNGDGINDIYKAKQNHKSIVEFKAYIFNRWGQKLFEWTNIGDGWDGTYNGKPVKDGTYFVLVKARGADGQEYKIKRDVNILRNYTEQVK